MNQILPSGEFVTLIHLTYRVAKEDFSENSENGELWRIACMPNMREFGWTPYHPHYERTSEYRAVTCPACKNTDMYNQLIQWSNA